MFVIFHQSFNVNDLCKVCQMELIFILIFILLGINKVDTISIVPLCFLVLYF